MVFFLPAAPTENIPSSMIILCFSDSRFFSTTFCIIQFLAHPHQINWTNSLTFNPIYSKLKASAEGTSFEMPKNSLFFTEKISFEAIWWVSATPPVQIPPVQHRLCITACATPPVQHNKQQQKNRSFVTHNFLAASVKNCFQDTNFQLKTFCFFKFL